MMQKERAELNSRPRATADDRRRYSGIAVNPLARQWLRRRYLEARQSGKKTEAARRAKEMRALGMEV